MKVNSDKKTQLPKPSSSSSSSSEQQGNSSCTNTIATPWAIKEMQTTCDDQVDTEEIRALPQVAWQDVQVEDLLGQGGFSSVNQVQVRLEVDQQERRFALKRLRTKRIRCEDDLVVAVTDLCYEAHLLSTLDHPHIVSLQGVAAGSVSQAFSQSHGPGYFLLLDILHKETLADRLKQWRHELKTGLFPLLRRKYSIGTNSNPTPPTSLYQRLQDIAVPIAQAMNYLHDQHGIILRDLKPQNVGFDRETGALKLFDFGMARPLDDCDSEEIAGTFRYMAPEVILGPKVDFKADVYSFGVLLWEVATLSKPFQNYFSSGKLSRPEAFEEAVSKGGWRPSLTGIPCRATRRLIQKCWDPTPRRRPTFARVWLLVTQLCKEKQQVAKKKQRVIKEEQQVTNPKRNNLPKNPSSFQAFRNFPKHAPTNSESTEATTTACSEFETSCRV